MTPVANRNNVYKEGFFIFSWDTTGGHLMMIFFLFNVQCKVEHWLSKPVVSISSKIFDKNGAKRIIRCPGEDGGS